MPQLSSGLHVLLVLCKKCEPLICATTRSLPGDVGLALALDSTARNEYL